METRSSWTKQHLNAKAYVVAAAYTGGSFDFPAEFLKIIRDHLDATINESPAWVGDTRPNDSIQKLATYWEDCPNLGPDRGGTVCACTTPLVTRIRPSQIYAFSKYTDSLARRLETRLAHDERSGLRWCVWVGIEYCEAGQEYGEPDLIRTCRHSFSNHKFPLRRL